jgi:exopolysaccharide biosynthesis WecB/TagA/CpsF family protein
MSENRIDIMGVGVNDIDLDGAVDILLSAARSGERGYVCVTGAHGVIESQRDEGLRAIHNSSLLTVADGMPNVWLGRLLGYKKIARVYGPDLMLAVCDAGRAKADAGCGMRDVPRQSLTHFLYGANGEKLAKLKANLEQRYPGIRIVGTYAPPFRALDDEEERELREMVAECRPDFFWVGLSTPKQERFMAEHAAACCARNDPESSKIDRIPNPASRTPHPVPRIPHPASRPPHPVPRTSPRCRHHDRGGGGLRHSLGLCRGCARMDQALRPAMVLPPLPRAAPSVEEIPADSSRVFMAVFSAGHGIEKIRGMINSTFSCLILCLAGR